MHERLTGGPAGVTSLAASADGRWLAAAGGGGAALWSLEEGGPPRRLSGHEDAVTAGCFTPDGSRLVSASSDKTLRLFEPGSGRCLATMAGHLEAVTALAVSPDGRLAASAGGADLKLWDLAKAVEAVALAGHSYEITGCAFSPDGRLIASASWDRSIKLWDVHTGAEAATLHGHEWQVEALAFSPDGTRLVSGGADGVVLLWDLATGACLFRLSDHEPTVRITACLFAPHGSWFATASRDGSLRLRETASGRALATFVGASPITAAAVSPLGDLLATGDSMGRVHLLKVHGVPDEAPLVRPVRLFRFETGAQEAVETARCPACARRFAPGSAASDVVSCPHCGQGCRVPPACQLRPDAGPGSA
jgi:WD40 repeat protein